MIFDSDAVPVKVVRGEGVPGGGGLVVEGIVAVGVAGARSPSWSEKAWFEI